MKVKSPRAAVKKPKKQPKQRIVFDNRRIDAILITAVLVIGTIIGTQYWNSWVAKGNKPVFYQKYFEPAVMIACGKGFVASKTQPPELVQFLNTQVDRFDCRNIPADLPLGREWLYQGAWRYLLTTVGWYWWLSGVSWSGMGPLFGMFFAMTLAVAYAISRLGAGALLAIAVVRALSISTLHLNNLPHLRDYAKAPFTLGLILILGLLVSMPFRTRTVLLLSAAYGLLLGIGYGFRTDFLANLPFFPLVLFAFAPGYRRHDFGVKAVGALIFLGAFLIVSWPVTSTVYTQGGCQWHVTLLGLQAPFDRDLRIARAPYDFGYRYVDEYIARNVDAFASRAASMPVKVGYCTPEYDAQSWGLLKNLILSFPADFEARALAATARVVELPFTFAKSQTMQNFYGDGKLLVSLCLIMTSAVSLRVAFFMLFFVLYFGGYPAVQFADRHYFHLEFIAWWALVFVIHQTVVVLRDREHSIRKAPIPALRRVGVFVAVAVAVLVIPLNLLRFYQQRKVNALLSAYIEAPKQPVLGEAVTHDGFYAASARGTPSQFIEVDLNLGSCGPKAGVQFRYDQSVPVEAYELGYTFDGSTRSSGTTRIFLLAFERFTGIEFSGVQPGCVAGAYRMTEPQRFPLLLDALLPPEWQRLPLYQRLVDWD